MRRICSGALLMATIIVLSGLGAGTTMAYRPRDSRYYNDYYRGGPGMDYDCETGYSGVYDHGGSSGTQGNTQMASDNTVRSYPGFDTNVPDAPTHEFDPNYWWDWDDDDDDWDDDDWWHYSGGPGAQYGQGWRYSPNGWWSQLYGGNWLPNSQQLTHSRWYRFDQSRYMVTGRLTGGDGNKYYLNPVDGGTLGMTRTGWQVIDGRSCYSSTQSDGTMGRLYTNTATPDGYQVEPDSVLLQ